MKPNNSGIRIDDRTLNKKKLDLAAGSLPFEMLNPKRDWTPWVAQKKDKTIGDPQSKDFSTLHLETMSCTNFAGGHVLEQHIIWKLVNGLVPQVTIDWMKSMGAFLDPNNYYTLEISKRASAIMSGTTAEGNHVQAVWDSFRHDGVVFASKLPSLPDAYMTEEEYLNPTVITPLMKAEALAFLLHFDIAYEWVQGYDSTGGFSQLEQVNSQRMLYCSPLQIVIPGHSLVMLNMQDKNKYDVEDTYKPFIRTNDDTLETVQCAMRAYITMKPQPASIPTDLFSRLLAYLKEFMSAGGKIVTSKVAGHGIVN